MENPEKIASWSARTAARFLRLIPLVSGCGKIANRQRFRSLAATNGGVWVQTRWGSHLLCYLDDYVGRALFYFGDLDPKLSWALEKVLKPGDRFVDVGANVGLLTLLGSKLVGESGRVLAIEPQPKVLSCLEKALLRNETTNVEVGGYGLGAESGQMVLHVPAGNLGGASFRNIPQAEANAVEVSVRTFSDVAQGTSFASAKLVKLDVEGLEAEVIQGAEAVWRENPPEVVIFEFRESGQARESEVGRLLSDLGYRFYRLPRNWFVPRLVTEEAAKSGKAVSHDVVAIHQTAPYEPLEHFNSRSFFS